MTIFCARKTTVAIWQELDKSDSQRKTLFNITTYTFADGSQAIVNSGVWPNTLTINIYDRQQLIARFVS